MQKWTKRIWKTRLPRYMCFLPHGGGGTLCLLMHLSNRHCSDKGCAVWEWRRQTSVRGGPEAVLRWNASPSGPQSPDGLLDLGLQFISVGGRGPEPTGTGKQGRGQRDTSELPGGRTWTEPFSQQLGATTCMKCYQSGKPT